MAANPIDVGTLFAVPAFLLAGDVLQRSLMFASRSWIPFYARQSMGSPHTLMAHLTYASCMMLPLIAMIPTLKGDGPRVNWITFAFWVFSMALVASIQGWHINQWAGDPPFSDRSVLKTAYRWPFLVAGGVAMLLAFPWAFQRGVPVPHEGSKIWKVMLYTSSCMLLLYSVVTSVYDVLAIYIKDLPTKVFWAIQGTCAFLFLFVLLGLQLVRKEGMWRFLLTPSLFQAGVVVLLLLYTVRAFLVNATSGMLAMGLFPITLAFLLRNQKVSGGAQAFLACLVLMSMVAVTSDMRTHWLPATHWESLPSNVENDVLGLHGAQLPSCYIVDIETSDGVRHRIEVGLSEQDQVRLAKTTSPLGGLSATVYVGRHIRSIHSVRRLDAFGTSFDLKSIGRAINYTVTQEPTKGDKKRTRFPTLNVVFNPVKNATMFILEDRTVDLFAKNADLSHWKYTRHRSGIVQKLFANPTILFTVFFIAMCIVYGWVLSDASKIPRADRERWFLRLLALAFSVYALIGSPLFAMVQVPLKNVGTWVSIAVTILTGTLFALYAFFEYKFHKTDSTDEKQRDRLTHRSESTLTLIGFLALVSPVAMASIQFPKT